MDNREIVHGVAGTAGANGIRGPPPQGQNGQQPQQPNFALIERAFIQNAAAYAQLAAEIPKLGNLQPAVDNNAILQRMQRMQDTQQEMLQQMQQTKNTLQQVQNTQQRLLHELIVLTTLWMKYKIKLEIHSMRLRSGERGCTILSFETLGT